MPQTAHELLNELERRGLVSPGVLASLKSQVAKAAQPIAASTVAKVLVEKRHLTAAQAEQLLASAGGGVKQPGSAGGKSSAAKAAHSKASSSKSFTADLAPLDDLQPLDELEPLADLAPLDDLPLENLSGDDLAPLEGTEPLDELEPLAEPAAAAVIPLDDLAALDPLAAPSPSTAATAMAATGKPAKRGTATKAPMPAPAMTMPQAAALPTKRKSSLGMIAAMLVALVLLGGGAAAALLLFPRGSGEELLAEAHSDYEAKQYDAAAAKYQTLIADYPASEHSPAARVRLAASKVLSARAASPQSWQPVLTAAKEHLPPAAGLSEFSQVQGDLAPLVMEMAAQLADEADQGAATSANVEAAREALALANDGRIVPGEIRQWQRLELAAERMSLAAHEIARSAVRQTAIAAIQKAAAAGDCQAALAERARLVAVDSDLASDASLQEALRELATAAAGKASIAEYAAAGQRAERKSGILGSVALAAPLQAISSSEPGPAVVVPALGSAWCLDSATGRVLWRRGGAHSPLRMGAGDGSGVLLIEQDGLELVRVDTRSGALVWRHGLPGKIAGAPLVMGGRVIVATRAGQLLALDAESGNGQASAQLPQTARVGSIADSAGEHLIQLADDSMLYALSPADLKCDRCVYVGHDPVAVVVSPTLLPKHLVVCENRGLDTSKLHVLALDAGGLPEAVVQMIEVPGQILAQPAVLSGKLLVATTSGRVRAWESAADPAKGLAEIAKFEFSLNPSTSPADVVRYPLVASDKLLIAGQGLHLLGPPAGGSFKSVWSALNDAPLAGPPQQAGDKLVALRRQSGTGGVVAAGLSVADGKVRWETRLGERTLHLNLAADTKSVSVRTATGLAATIPLADFVGHKVAVAIALAASPVSSAHQLAPLPWREGQIRLSPSGEVSYVDSASGALKAEPFQLRISTGQQLVHCDAAPAGDGGRQLAISDGHSTLSLLDLAGEGAAQLVQVASAKLASGPVSGVMVGNGVIGVVDRRGQLVTFSLPELAPAAAVDIGARVVLAGPTRVGEATALATDRGELIGIDRALAMAWKVPLAHGGPGGDLATSEGGIVLACRSGWLSLHDGQSGAELAAADLGEPLAGTPLVAGREVLVPTAGGAILRVALPSPQEGPP